MEENDIKIVHAVDRRQIKAHLVMNTKECTTPGRTHTDFVQDPYILGVLKRNSSFYL